MPYPRTSRWLFIRDNEVVVPAEDGFRRRYVTAGRDGVVKVLTGSDVDDQDFSIQNDEEFVSKNDVLRRRTVILVGRFLQRRRAVRELRYRKKTLFSSLHFSDRCGTLRTLRC